jgi:hypothetical protein
MAHDMAERKAGGKSFGRSAEFNGIGVSFAEG